MISELQREALALLAEVWELSPDVRLGQLFAHLGFLGEAHLNRSLGYIDDDELMSVMHKHREELRTRLQTQPNQLLCPTGAAVSAGVAEAVDASAPHSCGVRAPAEQSVAGLAGASSATDTRR